MQLLAGVCSFGTQPHCWWTHTGHVATGRYASRLLCSILRVPRQVQPSQAMA